MQHPITVPVPLTTVTALLEWLETRPGSFRESEPYIVALRQCKQAGLAAHNAQRAAETEQNGAAAARTAAPEEESARA